MEVKKDHLEHNMVKYQDCIEQLREEDAEELEQLKKMLKNLKNKSEDMDYEMIRLAKTREQRKKKLRYEVEDMELNIYNIKKTETHKKNELCDAQKELQKMKDKVDVQTKKLQDDVHFYETE